MRLLSRLHAALILLVLLVPLSGLALIGPASAQVLKQMALTDKHVTSFIAAQTDFAPLVVKLSEAAEEPSDALKAELGEVAKKHGFATFDEYMDVSDNIAYVMGGLNAKTLEFTDPTERKKAEIAEIEGDVEIPAEEKSRAVDYLKTELAAMVPLQFKESVEVVKRHFPELQKLVQEEGAGDGLEDGEAGDAGEGAVEGPVDGEPGEPVAP